MIFDSESLGVREMLLTGKVPVGITTRDIVAAIDAISVRRQALNQLTRRETTRLLRSGELRKAECCEQCGVIGALEAHHMDYDDAKAIRWFCKPCHVYQDKLKRIKDS